MKQVYAVFCVNGATFVYKNTGGHLLTIDKFVSLARIEKLLMLVP